MSDSTPQDDLLDDGMDQGTGDPGDDRAFLMDQPPAEVDELELDEEEDDLEVDEEE